MKNLYEIDIDSINSDPIITSVGKVRYYDDETESFQHGELTFKNYSYSILNINGNLSECKFSTVHKYYIHLEDNKNFSFLAIVQEDEDIIGHFMVNYYRSLINGQYVLEEDQIPKTMNHFEILNKNLEERRQQFRSTITEQYNDFKINEEIIDLVRNFIGYCDIKHFLDIDYFCAFEKKLFTENRKGIDFIINDSRYAKFDEVFSEVSVFFNNDFSMLNQIICEKVNIPTEQCIFLTWTLMKELSVVHFSSTLNKEYGEYLDSCNNIEECAEAFVTIDTVNSDSMVNASLLSYYCMFRFPELKLNFLEMYKYICSEISKAKEQVKLNSFHQALTRTPQEASKISIDDIDLMDGHEFEYFISTLFTKMGYSTKVTKGSGDQGIDVIAEKNLIKIGIQAKCYSNSITNKAVQEVVAGVKHYNLNKAIVVTNNYFTDSAMELANSNDVILWDRTILKEKINEYF
jgi:Predicted endonuclease distantly related to archaeal Holliday junction resolvase and Mrr-like restriction enzymes